MENCVDTPLNIVTPPVLLKAGGFLLTFAFARVFYGRSMATPCRSYGCANLVTSRTQKGYCDNHADLRIGWAKIQAYRGSASKRGYGTAWRKLRNEIMKRDNHICQVCLKDGRYTPATEVDHIINKARGGTDNPDNLQAICRKCHQDKTRRESWQGRGG